MNHQTGKYIQEDVSSRTQRILKYFKDEGIPYKSVKIQMNPVVERAVSKFIQTIEEAHINAENSKLVFKVVA
jgi:hypothetical protein